MPRPWLGSPSPPRHHLPPPATSRVERSRIIALGWPIFLVLFFAACFNYALHLNLWGDEAFSLVAATPGSGFRDVDAHHLPTYYWLLAVVVRLVGDEQEILLRMIHVLPFVVGLGFGLRTVYRIFPDERVVLLVATLAIFLPNYIFYATNLRMYSLLFMVSMGFIDAVSRLLSAGSNASSGILTGLALAGGALVCSDYAAGMYYLAGVVMVGLYSYTQKNLWPLLAVAAPGLGLVLIGAVTFDDILAIKNWGIEDYRGPGWAGWVNGAKWLYLACRPGLDLLYPAPLAWPLALGLPLGLIGLLGLASWHLWQRRESLASPRVWLLVVALLWVPLVPTGYSFTRLFLPSQFFMVTILVWWLLATAHWLRPVGLVGLGLLLAVNLGQAISPTLQPYSLVPFQTIAADLVNYGEEHGVSHLLLSNNSLNSLSIEHYVQKNVQDSNQLRVKQVDSAGMSAFLRENQGVPFLFVSHMGENGQFVDRETVPLQVQTPLKGYVALAELPYNQLWLKRYQDRAQQDHIIQTYQMQ